MNSIKDKYLKKIKKIQNDDLKHNDKEIINCICFEEQFDICIRKI
jgi:hypothetical protein